MRRSFLFFAVLGFLLSSALFAEDERVWPHKFPCRVSDSGNPDLFVMTLGDVRTPLAQGVFDPEKDVVTLSSGETLPDYYKQILGIRFFKPINKKHFPLPPSGWCSWYYYYKEITPADVLENARWMAAHLKDYGGNLCQLDDGWQIHGRSSKDNRDWTRLDERFRSGMDQLAAEIKQLGLTPGLWLAPHGQSNPEVVEKWGNFLLDRNGESLSDTWEGDYLVDPTHPRTSEFFRELFSTMKGWGYQYFKIDGQPIVVREYKKLREHFHNPEKDPVEAYRDTIKTIKDTIGPDTYLLGCWGIPLEMMGIAEGSRTGGDVRLAWDPGVMAVYRTTMQHYYLHNVAWYNDTDVLLVRPPLTMGMARVWATLMGLTAQAMLTSEQFNNLSPERVDIIKRVFPSVDIRPFDLFPVRDKMKRIFDLKVNHLGRDYDVVGLINPDQFQNTDIHLKWEDLGLSSDSRMHVFDFWNREYLGCFKKGLFLSLNPASCRVFALLADQDRPQLVSTSRHITQGWVDLKALDYDAQAQSISGKSHIIAHDTYTLRFAYPSGKNFRIKTATAQDAAIEVKNHMFWSEVCLTSPVTRPVSWQVTFEPTEYYHHTVRPPDRIRITDLDDNTKALTLRTTYYNHIGYYIYLDQELQGIAFSPRVILKKDQLKNISTIEVSGVWSDGRESTDGAKVEIK